MICRKQANVLYPTNWLAKTPVEQRLIGEPRIDDDLFAIPTFDQVSNRGASDHAPRGAFVAPPPKRRPRLFLDMFLTALELLAVVSALCLAAYVIGMASAI